MRRSYVPRRFKYCTLSRYHDGACHRELLFLEGDGVLGPPGFNPVDPRCLDAEEHMQDDFVFEPSLVRHVYVPFESVKEGSCED